MKERLNHISFLQFVGPIFVILGHSTNNMPSSDVYYIFTKIWIYLFHMPLFFFISGYMFSYKKGLENKQYSKFILVKFKRLLIPYLIWNLLFIIPKFLVSNFIVDDVEFSFNYIMKLIITPRANIWGHTWFLAALFILFVIAPIFDILMRVKRNKCLIWTIITITLIICYIFPMNSGVLALSDLSKDTLFFWIGIMIGQVPTERLKSTFTKLSVFIIVFSITLIFTFIRLVITDFQIITMVTCFFTIITLLIIPIVFNIKQGYLDKMSKRSFGIYIMHWPVMLLVRIVFYQIMGMNSGIVIILMALSGFVIPNFIIWVLQRYKSKKLEKSLQYLVGI